jgi:undecaprenyl pyrophosphate synthase
MTRLMRRIMLSTMQYGAVPRHIGFIMDGNRRYGRKVHVGNGKGYYLGYETLEEVILDAGYSFVQAWANKKVLTLLFCGSLSYSLNRSSLPAWHWVSRW